MGDNSSAMLGDITSIMNCDKQEHSRSTDCSYWELGTVAAISLLFPDPRKALCKCSDSQPARKYSVSSMSFLNLVSIVLSQVLLALLCWSFWDTSSTLRLLVLYQPGGGELLFIFPAAGQSIILTSQHRAIS